jgi:hypothetical protein
MVKRTVGHGFTAVPYESVTLNGHPLRGLNNAVEPYNGPWAMIAPCGKAVDGEDGRRPHLYASIDDCVEDAETLSQIGYSVCS